MMQFTVLGGSAASPGPGQGCSGYLVGMDGFHLLLDIGPGTLPELRKHIGLAQIDGLVISHLHSDHTLDLVPLRYGLKYAPGASRRRVPLWMPPAGLDFLQRLADVYAIGAEPSDHYFSEVFDLAEYNPARELQLGSLVISFAPTRHFVPCWAMRLTVGEGDAKRVLVYIADTGPDESLLALADGADLLVCEATLPMSAENTGENSGHLSARQAGQFAQKSAARRLLLTHMWVELDVGDAVAAAAAEFSGPILVARPGLTVDI